MIFISYSRKDYDAIVKPIIEAIKLKFGENVFFLDTKNIEHGKEFMSVISNALEKTSIFLPIITQNYLESPTCMWESDAFYLEAKIKDNRKVFLPYYPKEIWDVVPLMYKAINSMIGKSPEYIVEQIQNLKDGKRPITENIFSNKYEISKTYNNAVEISIVNHEWNLRNPKVFIKPKINSDLIDIIGSEKKYINAFSSKWDILSRMTNVDTDNKFVEDLNIGIYLSGELAKITISIFVNDENMQQKIAETILKHGGFINLIDSLKIIDGADEKKMINLIGR